MTADGDTLLAEKILRDPRKWSLEAGAAVHIEHGTITNVEVGRPIDE
jgi:hypothetical protein